MTDQQHGDEQAQSSDRAQDQRVDRVLAGLALLVLAVGTVGFRLLEDWSWVDAFYFSAVAVTTVGFGDLAPTSDAAKLFTVLYIFSGITIFSVFLNERFKRNARRRTRRSEQ